MVTSEEEDRLYTTYTLFKKLFRQVHIEASTRKGTNCQASK